MSTLTKIMERGLGRQVNHPVVVEINAFEVASEDLKKSLRRMTNKDKFEFLNRLISKIRSFIGGDVGAFMDEGVLFKNGFEKSNVFKSSGLFFYTMTEDSRQFFCWFGAPDILGPDNKGNCLFSASCEDAETLEDWIDNFTKNYVPFKNPNHGTVWLR